MDLMDERAGAESVPLPSPGKCRLIPAGLPRVLIPESRPVQDRDPTCFSSSAPVWSAPLPPLSGFRYRWGTHLPSGVAENRSGSKLQPLASVSVQSIVMGGTWDSSGASRAGRQWGRPWPTGPDPAEVAPVSPSTVMVPAGPAGVAAAASASTIRAVTTARRWASSM